MGSYQYERVRGGVRPFADPRARESTAFAESTSFISPSTDSFTSPNLVVRMARSSDRPGRPPDAVGFRKAATSEDRSLSSPAEVSILEFRATTASRPAFDNDLARSLDSSSSYPSRLESSSFATSSKGFCPSCLAVVRRYRRSVLTRSARKSSSSSGGITGQVGGQAHRYGRWPLWRLAVHLPRRQDLLEWKGWFPAHRYRREVPPPYQAVSERSR